MPVQNAKSNRLGIAVMWKVVGTLQRAGFQLKQDTSRLATIILSSRKASNHLWENEDENLAGGFKPLRDAISQALGIDDGDQRIRFTVSQVMVPTGAPGGTSIVITTSTRP